MPSHTVTSPKAHPPELGTNASIDPLSLAVLQLFAQGNRYASIADQLGLSPRTVRRHIRSICDNLDVQKPIQAVVWAARNSLLNTTQPRTERDCGTDR